VNNGKKDYPAAHSADTTWFAIDECGHVACLYSGESGAIPHGAATDQITTSDEDNNDMSRWHNRERLAVATLAPAHVHWMAKTFNGRHRDPKYAIGGMFFILNNHNPKLEKILDHSYSDVPSDRPVMRVIEPSKKTGKKKYVLLTIFSNNQDPSVIQKIHTMGLCVACTSAFTINPMTVGKKGSPLVHYDHPSANCAAHPYMLKHVPEELKTLDELDLSRGEKLALKDGVAIKGCFLDKPFWQPAVDLDCQLYEEDDPVVKVGSKTFKQLLTGLFGYW